MWMWMWIQMAKTELNEVFYIMFSWTLIVDYLMNLLILLLIVILVGRIKLKL